MSFRKKLVKVENRPELTARRKDVFYITAGPKLTF